jgi:CRISPR-associated protein Cas1
MPVAVRTIEPAPQGGPDAHTNPSAPPISDIPLAKPRRVLPPRLGHYSAPDLNAIDLEAKQGASVRSLWQRYAANSPAPLRYAAFARRYEKWRAARSSGGEFNPAIPNHQPSENTECPPLDQISRPRKAPASKPTRYTAPDLASIDCKVLQGVALKSLWEEYSAKASKPVRYKSFTRIYQRYVASKAPRPEIAPGIPDYTPAENAVAESYWGDRADPHSTMHVLAGFGCSLNVEHGVLVAFDTGVVRKFEPTGHRLSAIVFGSFGGVISTAAIQWCAVRGITIIVLDYHGGMVSVTAPITPANIANRRAQFAADPLVIAKAILRQKLAGAIHISKQSEFAFGLACAQISTARNVETLLQIEGTAALDYWGQWQLALRHHARGWPQSWSEFHNRGSVISGSSQHATHPVNAILNYAYSVAAGLCVRSLIAAGFDPCAGYLHVDRHGRYSLAYDLLELLRPEIDHAILPWIASHSWRRADFPVTTSGIVRVHPNLARVVMQRTAAAVPPARVDKAADWLRDRICTGRSHRVAVAALLGAIPGPAVTYTAPKDRTYDCT